MSEHPWGQQVAAERSQETTFVRKDKSRSATAEEKTDNCSTDVERFRRKKLGQLQAKTPAQWDKRISGRELVPMGKRNTAVERRLHNDGSRAGAVRTAHPNFFDFC
jgi:hypothetical protein